MFNSTFFFIYGADPLDDPLVNASIRAAERTRAAARFSSGRKAISITKGGGVLTNLLFSRASSSDTNTRTPSQHRTPGSGSGSGGKGLLPIVCLKLNGV